MGVCWEWVRVTEFVTEVTMFVKQDFFSPKCLQQVHFSSLHASYAATTFLPGVVGFQNAEVGGSIDRVFNTAPAPHLIHS